MDSMHWLWCSEIETMAFSHRNVSLSSDKIFIAKNFTIKHLSYVKRTIVWWNHHLSSMTEANKVIVKIMTTFIEIEEEYS